MTLAPNEQKLIRRYLLWCYKTTKESLDRVDRKFTQLMVDERILKTLMNRALLSHSSNLKLNNLIKEFKRYVVRKRQDARREKFADTACQQLRGEYAYLGRRLAAVEEAALFFLGKKELKKMAAMYEAEMTRRILEASTLSI